MLSQWRTQKFSKEGASAAYFGNFTAWLMARRKKKIDVSGYPTDSKFLLPTLKILS
jgi:hypothetical protein